jgi:hypothetical protein
VAPAPHVAVALAALQLAPSALVNKSGALWPAAPTRKPAAAAAAEPTALKPTALEPLYGAGGDASGGETNGEANGEASGEAGVEAGGELGAAADRDVLGGGFGSFSGVAVVPGRPAVELTLAALGFRVARVRLAPHPTRDADLRTYTAPRKFQVRKLPTSWLCFTRACFRTYAREYTDRYEEAFFKVFLLSYTLHTCTLAAFVCLGRFFKKNKNTNGCGPRRCRGGTFCARSGGCPFPKCRRKPPRQGPATAAPPLPPAAAADNPAGCARWRPR